MSRLTRRATCAALLSAVFAPAWAQDTAALSVHELEWADASRQRSVPVRLYLPAGAAGVGIERVPLVVFSHGIGGSRAGYSYLGRHFASQGVASLHLQHVGSDRSLWLGNPLSLVGRLHDAAQDSEAIARVQDLRFALDRLLAHDLGSRIDAARIVAAGHSYGANTTLLAAGARVERQGQVVDFRDPRVKAAIVISAPPFYGETDPSKILAHVTVPSLHITATEDIIRIPGLRERRRGPRGGVRRRGRLAQDAGGLCGRIAQRLHRPRRHGWRRAESADQDGDEGAVAGLRAQRVRRR
jgi:predicted dienelactone hydrolase